MTSKKENVASSEFLAVWDNNANTKEEVFPENVTLGSAKKVWWKCAHGHSYQQAVNKKVRAGKDSCSVCSGRLIVPGVNDLQTLYPGVAKEWDCVKNVKKPEEISPGSEIKRFWLCSKGHSFTQTPFQRAKSGYGCPYCSNQKVLKGFNDLATTHPEIAKMWDYKKNSSNKTPYTITSGHDKKVWWLCNNGHLHSQSPYEKIYANKGCAICSGKAVEKGINDLATVEPEFLAEWDYAKNKDLSPHELTFRSNKKVWWICSNGHSYERSPNEKYNKKLEKVRECPYCSNKKTLPGFNDLATINPILAKRWDYEKNNLKPQDVGSGTHTKIWWTCEKGHSIFSPVKDTSSKCYKCCSSGISRSEEELLAYVKSILPEDIEVEENTRKVIPPYELDIYIPDKHVAIEFNGIYWHSEKNGKDRNYHRNKWTQCKQNGVQLITIWEDDWRDRNAIVKNMLAHKLGVSSSKKVYARNTYVGSVDKVIARKFCDDNHIQGFVPGSFYLGLFDKKTKDLVAVSIWRKLKDTIYLDRYCTSLTLPGGMGKLLKCAKKEALSLGCSSIVTFADKEVSNGELYEKLGFKVDKELRPDYKYFYKNSLVHKFNFRKNRFKDDAELLYKENLTERELALLNDIPRVWDCGKIRYILFL